MANVLDLAQQGLSSILGTTPVNTGNPRINTGASDVVGVSTDLQGKSHKAYAQMLLDKAAADKLARETAAAQDAANKQLALSTAAAATPVAAVPAKPSAATPAPSQPVASVAQAPAPAAPAVPSIAQQQAQQMTGYYTKSPWWKEGNDYLTSTVAKAFDKGISSHDISSAVQVQNYMASDAYQKAQLQARGQSFKSNPITWHPKAEQAFYKVFGYAPNDVSKYIDLPKF